LNFKPSNLSQIEIFILNFYSYETYFGTEALQRLISSRNFPTYALTWSRKSCNSYINAEQARVGRTKVLLP
jgi:hypothetical protein